MRKETQKEVKGPGLVVWTHQTTTPTVNPPLADFAFSSYSTVKFTAIFPKETHYFANRQFFHGHWLSDGKELITVLFKIFTQTDAKSSTMSKLREGRKAWKSLILKGKAWHK